MSGSLRVTSIPEGDVDDLKGTTFSLSEFKLEGNSLSFLVLTFPQETEECLHFDLHLRGGKLVGTAIENDPDDSDLVSMPVEFQRNERQ